MGRKKLDNKKTETLATRLTDKESNNVRFVSNVLGLNVARFISMCIQEWLSNHSSFIKLITKESNKNSKDGGQA